MKLILPLKQCSHKIISSMISLSGSDSKDRRSILKYILLAAWAVIGLILSWGVAKLAFFTNMKAVKREVSKETLAKIQIGVPFHVPEAGAWLIRTANGELLALDDRCTHLGCRYKWNSQRELFECPCHRSEFDMLGKVITGPAVKEIPRLSIRSEEGSSVVLVL